ncbi:alpha/beta hydrolase family protein [Sphingobacterium sp. SGL-16]|uniref:alpha/beta hydrolase family protein n=1 Tax=Sphingobacterium sp. SGL-16 TaxID=2710883 RepID=UPI0013EA6E94|nr:prolyl oligopeptidase family serine peptidase [Sphingobacterium sp. SGL-16]NGM74503.1 prolyl oligopeptidase family serine peptidase [Sphingobacterium sp. SGL-16]
MTKKSILFFACQLAWLTPFAQEASKVLSWQDVPKWEYVRMNGATPSPDGKWLAYVSGPTEGDLTLTLRHTQDTTKFDYKIGGATTPIFFNQNAQYFSFFENQKFSEIKANEKSRRPSSKKLKIVALKDTASVTFDKVQSFSFSNQDSKWVAIRFEGQNPGASPAMGGATRPTDVPKGADLLLYNLITKKKYNLGNVSEYSFNKSGQYLAYIIDANGKNGNGIFLMDLNTGISNALHNDEANFSRISWNKEGTAFALLKSKTDKKYKDPVYTLLGIKNLKAHNADVFTYSGLDENQITAGFGISQNANAYWSKDLKTIFFGVAKLEKAEEPKSTEKKIDDIAKADAKKVAEKDSTAKENAAAIQKDSTQIANNGPKTPSTPKKPEVNKKDLEKPDMIIWNWQDVRLQSVQKNRLQTDKNYTTMSAWHVDENKFVSLADSAVKSISLAPNQTVGYGFDFKPYEYESNLNGQTYGDLYIVDIKTGQKKLALKKLYLNASRSIRFSPNSDLLLLHQDGHFHVLNTKTLALTNITQNIPASFVDMMEDRNVEKAATSSFGFTADNKFVLLLDNFDLWKVSVDGKSANTLTDNWKSKKLMTTGVNYIYEDDEFIDLKKDQYFGIYNHDTKQKGVALLASNSNKLQILKLDDINFGGIRKPKNSTNLFYTIEKSNVAPDIFVASDKTLSQEKQLTNNNPENKKGVLSAGSKLISYVTAHGDTLEATLYLPANYEEGKSYPTITYIYERLTYEKNNYSQPAYPGGGFNRAMYTNNGYAVLMPDIKYKLNDPGMSAVACVVPAVKAAIATGIVDEKNVAIHGHSWGGYQTSFLITQTDIFKAAVAGAPLTNMISMYSLIYWNSGSSNQSIFESSQGRLTTGYWDNWDAYVRNSPIYHIKKVNTPLVIMHNDKDGAVDYTQGIEYYNSLRRLNKPVVMLTYNGENHGLMKEVNKKDYAVRMMEYFDHYLKGKPAPDWWAKGVDYIDLPKHLEERAF